MHVCVVLLNAAIGAQELLSSPKYVTGDSSFGGTKGASLER
jgi:hypothetical protein